MELVATVLALEAKYRRRERMVLDVVKLSRTAVEAVGKERSSVVGAMMSLLAATLDPSGGVVAGRMNSGGSWCGAAVRVCRAFSSLSRSI